MLNQCLKNITCRFARPRFLLIVIVATFLSGCGKPAQPTGKLSGTITVAGNPYSKPAELAIISMQTGQAYSTPITDGKFDFSKPILTGEYTAYLTPAATTGDTAQPMSITIDTSIEDKYWNEASSPLRVTIDPGNNTAELDIP